jgi:hypothetical protein
LIIVEGLNCLNLDPMVNSAEGKLAVLPFDRLRVNWLSMTELL